MKDINGSKPLLDKVTQNVQGQSFDVIEGDAFLMVWGDDFGGGVITVEQSTDNVAWVVTEDVDGDQAIFKNQDFRVLLIPAGGIYMRARLESSQNPLPISVRAMDNSITT